MQAELTTEHPELSIALLSINKTGAENGIPILEESDNLPIVGDSEEYMIWAQWGGDWCQSAAQGVWPIFVFLVVLRKRALSHLF